MKVSALFAVSASLAATSLASPIESRAVGGVCCLLSLDVPPSVQQIECQEKLTWGFN
jgi:hypothetical protein